MTEGAEPIRLSDWYELVQGDELMQGDILEGCPVFRPPGDLAWPLDQHPVETTLRWTMADAIILSQSCDIVREQKSDMWLVILCPMWTLSDMAQVNAFLNSSHGKEQCRRGNLPGYHMIAASNDERWQREVSIVSLRDLWSLPIDFVRSMAQGKGLRPRLRPPYREHLAQAFARYFMRVGLPSDIPRFSTDKAEAEAIRRLEVLDPDVRTRVLSAFS